MNYFLRLNIIGGFFLMSASFLSCDDFDLSKNCQGKSICLIQKNSGEFYLYSKRLKPKQEDIHSKDFHLKVITDALTFKSNYINPLEIKWLYFQESASGFPDTADRDFWIESKIEKANYARISVVRDDLGSHILYKVPKELGLRFYVYEIAYNDNKLEIVLRSTRTTLFEQK